LLLYTQKNLIPGGSLTKLFLTRKLTFSLLSLTISLKIHFFLCYTNTQAKQCKFQSKEKLKFGKINSKLGSQLNEPFDVEFIQLFIMSTKQKPVKAIFISKCMYKNLLLFFNKFDFELSPEKKCNL